MFTNPPWGVEAYTYILCVLLKRLINNIKQKLFVLYNNVNSTNIIMSTVFKFTAAFSELNE